MSPAIEIKGLVTRIGDRTVHDGLDLTVATGSLVAIAGASGAGKTVLLRTMTRLLPAAGGQVRILGHDINRLDRAGHRALDRRIGMMFQRGALFTGLTVIENVLLPLREHTDLPMDLLREMARLKIHLAGLAPDAAALYPSELSGGMTKRAALARALALDPELLFLDEPTAGLDPLGAADFDGLIQRLRLTLGLTVVVVTHDVDSLWQIADDIAFLGHGRVLDHGPPEALAESREAAVRAYFSGARMQRARERTCNQE
jgi:phospholipid/cholesterol/gamma-HCH transport system ATP-binding protein